MNLTTLQAVKRFLGFRFGGILTVDVTTPPSGTGYTVAPDVVITDPTGSGFIGVAILAGDAVESVVVMDPGQGYSAPVVSFVGTGTGAAATATFDPEDQRGEDPLLTSLIAGASGLFYQLTSRKILLAADPANPKTEIRDGNGFGQNRITTLDSPIVSVDSVTVNGTAIVASPAWNQTGYVVDGLGDSIALRSRCFLEGIANIELVYTAGYADDSAEAAAISDAVTILVATKYKRISHIDQVSQTLNGQITASFSTKDVPPEVQTVIDRFSRPMVFGG